MNIRGIIHVGAHYGEEIPTYLAAGIKKIICFEPLEQNLEVLRKNTSNIVKIYPYALGDIEKVVEMYVSNNQAQSSSVLKPKKHLKNHRHVKFTNIAKVEMKTMSSFKQDMEDCNYLSIDVQGYEYEVLLGGLDLLNQFDYIYCEVNRDETYEGNKLVQDLDMLLSKYNFRRVETSWDGGIWGDALYIK